MANNRMNDVDHFGIHAREWELIDVSQHVLAKECKSVPATALPPHDPVSDLGQNSACGCASRRKKSCADSRSSTRDFVNTFEPKAIDFSFVSRDKDFVIRFDLLNFFFGKF